MNADYQFTSADFDLMPDDGKRYEIIDGELYVSKPTDCRHQYASVVSHMSFVEIGELSG